MEKNKPFDRIKTFDEFSRNDVFESMNDDNFNDVEEIDEGILDAIIRFFKGIFELFDSRPVKHSFDQSMSYVSKIENDENIKDDDIEENIDVGKVKKMNNEVFDSVTKKIRNDANLKDSGNERDEKKNDKEDDEHKEKNDEVDDENDKNKNDEKRSEKKNLGSNLYDELKKEISQQFAYISLYDSSTFVHIIKKMLSRDETKFAWDKRFTWVPEKYQKELLSNLYIKASWKTCEWYKSDKCFLSKEVKAMFIELVDTKFKNMKRVIEKSSKFYLDYILDESVCGIDDAKNKLENGDEHVYEVLKNGVCAMSHVVSHCINHIFDSIPEKRLKEIIANKIKRRRKNKRKRDDEKKNGDERTKKLDEKGRKWCDEHIESDDEGKWMENESGEIFSKSEKIQFKNKDEIVSFHVQFADCKYFYCHKCGNLKSLEGSPKKVSRDFYCSECDSLEDLKGAPKTVEDDFSCAKSASLKSLEGAPEKVGGKFLCWNCKSLRSLDGCSKEIGDNLDFSGCDELENIDALKNVSIGGKIIFDDCPKIKKYESILSDMDVFKKWQESDLSADEFIDEKGSETKVPKKKMPMKKGYKKSDEHENDHGQ